VGRPANIAGGGRSMKVTTFGIGYVGCVTAACLGDHDHDVTVSMRMGIELK